MKKCPLLKEYLTLPERMDSGRRADWKNTFRFLEKASGLKEVFQNCIGDECMAWNEKTLSCGKFIKIVIRKKKKMKDGGEI